MSLNISRRQLANYGVDQMIAGVPAQKIARYLVATLYAAGKQKDSELLLHDIDQELEDRGLVARARVTTASELSEELKQELRSKLKIAANVRSVRIVQQVDKSITGGLRVETANHSWDKSVKSLLVKLKEQI